MDFVVTIEDPDFQLHSITKRQIKPLLRIPEFDRRGIESFGVEGPLLHRLNPCLHILISLMLWISQDLQKLLISPQAAAVFGRTGPLPLDAAGIGRVTVSRQYAFKLNFMAPIVAEIIDVLERRSGQAEVLRYLVLPARQDIIVVELFVRNPEAQVLPVDILDPNSSEVRDSPKSVRSMSEPGLKLPMAAIRSASPFPRGGDGQKLRRCFRWFVLSIRSAASIALDLICQRGKFARQLVKCRIESLEYFADDFLGRFLIVGM